MFYKLNIKLPKLDANQLQGNKTTNWDDSIPDFREYEIKNIQYFLYPCREKLKFDIEPNHANITIIKKYGAVVPHTDVWPTALNFYLDVDGDETTMFYHNLTGHKIAVDDTPGLYRYDIDQLRQAENFSAKTDDCYLLNTHQPHSVSNQHNGSRTILRLIWLNHDYDTVLKSIKIL